MQDLTEESSIRRSEKQAGRLQNSSIQGVMLAAGVYFIWGFFPLYFNHLQPAGSLEVIVHRAFWGLAFCLAVLLYRKKLQLFFQVFKEPKVLWRLACAGFLIVANWSIYIYAIQHGHTIDAALGYFINPLFTVLLALLILREKTRPLQNYAIAFGVLAVAVLLIGMGRLPWVSIGLPLSFGLYSLVKKEVAHQVDAVVGMSVETLFVLPFLLMYYLWLLWSKQSSFQILFAEQASSAVIATHLLLLIGAGILTVIPLVMMAQAARFISLGLMGLLQYISPIMQLLIGVFVFHEPSETARWIGTAIVWLACLCLILDGLIQLRERRKLIRLARR